MLWRWGLGIKRCMSFFVSESFIGHAEMTSFAHCRTVNDNLHDWNSSAYQATHFKKSHEKDSEPQYDGKKKGLNPPAMRSATTKQKKDQFGFHNFLFVIKLPLPLVLPAVGFNSMKIIYCIHMALQVFFRFWNKKGTWQCSPRPMLQLPGDGWIHEESLQFAQIHHSPLVCECPTKMQFEKEFEKKATHESLCKSYFFYLDFHWTIISSHHHDQSTKPAQSKCRTKNTGLFKKFVLKTTQFPAKNEHLASLHLIGQLHKLF